MQHNRVVLVAGVAALAWHSTAHAGVPGWCKKPGSSEYRERVSDDPRDNVRSVVEYCGPQAGPAWDKAYASFSKQYAMTEQDWADAAEWVEHQGYSHSANEYKPQATALASLSPIDQYLLFAQVRRDMQGDFDGLYMADALDQTLTESGRIGLLAECVRHGGYEFPSYWAICADDVAKLDLAKLAAEIRADKTQSPVVRATVKLETSSLVSNLNQAKADYAELVKKDDAYKKLLEVASKGRADWAKTLGTMTELLALTKQLDSAVYFHSKKQFAGCEDAAEKALTAAISKIPAKTFEGMHDPELADPYEGFVPRAMPAILQFPEANLAANAFVLCEPERAWSAALSAVLLRGPGQRGPRSAAYAAIASQKFELDDTNAKEISVPPVDAHHRPYAKSATGLMMSWSGVVGSTKAGTGRRSGNPVIVVSQPKSSTTTEDCVKWHGTNKLIGWDTAGHPQYQEICDKVAPVKHDTTGAEFDLDPKTAALLKPGMRFSSMANNGDAEVFAIWPSKTAKLPSVVLGAPVK